MKLAELIETQQKSLAALEKRMAARPTRELAEKLGEASIEAKTRRIKQRISRLESQREMAVARIDAALASELAALAAIEKLPRPGPDGKREAPKARAAAAPSAKAKAGKTRAAPRARTTKAKASKKK
jgi:hypothetical protein